MTTMVRIAVLITSFNRRDITIRCIDKVRKLGNQLDIFLVDDCSSDGTSEEVEVRFPYVKIINGTGNLFWSRGMHLAWSHAARFDYDFYLWLNDDVKLYEDSLKELISCSLIQENRAIISGLIESEDKSEILYGGRDMKKNLLHADGQMKNIRFLNGNVVLVPRDVFKLLGNLDPIFHHDLGDVDYGLRAFKEKVSVLTTRVPVGSGIKNDISRLRKDGTNLVNRFRRLYSPLGNPPLINFYFRKKHFGLYNAIAYFIFLHFINVIPDSLNQRIFGKKYQ